jgi:hypothetical protein
MKRAAVWSLVVLVAGTGIALAKPKKKNPRRKGKVVRVERTRHEGAGLPRLCSQVQPDGQGGGTASCSGPPVQEGEVGSVVTENGQIAVLGVRSVQPMADGCGNTYAWQLTTDVRQGNLDQVTWQTYLLFDWKTNAQSRTLPNASMIPAPGGRTGEQIWAGIDDDGDEQPELMISWFTCDAAGQPSPYGQGGANCYVYYKREGSAYTELRLDVVKSCY